jgi:hypothetical protein
MNLGGEPFDVEEEDGRSIVKKELGVTGTIKAEQARRSKQKVLFVATFLNKTFTICVAGVVHSQANPLLPHFRSRSRLVSFSRT